MSTCEAVGPHACVIAGTIGYLIFAIGWVFVTAAFMRALLDARSAIARLRDRILRMNDGSRPLSPECAMRPAESPVLARRDPVNVLAFVPARRTRNRVVVR